jgi:hypothetical protein
MDERRASTGIDHEADFPTARHVMGVKLSLQTKCGKARLFRRFFNQALFDFWLSRLLQSLQASECGVGM